MSLTNYRRSSSMTRPTLAALLLWLRRSRGLEVESLLVLLRAALSIGHQPILDGAGNSYKGWVDVNVILGGAFPKGNSKLLGELLALFRADNLVIEHVALVSDEDLVDMDVGMLLNLGDPIANAFKRAAVRDIVDEQNPLGAAKVAGSNCAEPLLTRRVPNLELDARAVNIHVLNFKVNTDSGNKRRRERVVGVAEQQAGLSDARVADHEQFDLHVVRSRALRHGESSGGL